MPDRADKTVTIPGELRAMIAEWLMIEAAISAARRGGNDDFYRIARLRALAEEIGGDE